MKRIPVNDLSAGTKYSKPVFVDGEHLLVPEGVVIRQRDLARLKKWDVEFVETDGEIVTELSQLQETAQTIGNILDQLEYSIGSRKQRSIINCAKAYLSAHSRFRNHAVQFDVVLYRGSSQKPDRLQHAFTETGA